MVSWAMLCCFSPKRVSAEERNMNEDPSEHIGNSSPPPQSSTERLRKELKTLVPNADFHRYAQQVELDYRQKMSDDVENLNNLLEAFITVLRERTSHKQKDKGWNLPSAPWSTKPKMKVFSVVAAKTFGADDQILSKLDAEVCSSAADCDVVFVFCPVTSRVQSDVDDAMRGIPAGARGKSVILVVMHHSRKDISPSETEVNHGHQSVIQDVHVVYHETIKGLMNCGRNDRAMQTLKELSKVFTS